MADHEVFDRPIDGFGYSYWFSCTNCGNRINIAADEYQRQCTTQAAYSVCGCGTEVDISQESPTLRSLEDVAVHDDSVDSLYWYHTSRYENWPDIAAYNADVTESVSRSRILGLNPRRMLRNKTSLALHLGTYESAIENMLRRLHDQDRSDGPGVSYWLHRVEIRLEAGDLDPHVGDEFATLMGDVPLAELHHRGVLAVRYINVHEAPGSVSLAIDPKVIRTVSTIAIPVASAALPEADLASKAATKATVALVELEPLRPDTTGISPSSLNLAKLSRQPKNPTDPDSVRTYTIAKQLCAVEDRSRAIWAELTDTFVRHYLLGINEQVHERFLSTLGRGGDPEAYHRRFRVMAGLLTRVSDVIAQFASAPRRTSPLLE